jgi:hypothetical protein
MPDPTPAAPGPPAASTPPAPPPEPPTPVNVRVTGTGAGNAADPPGAARDRDAYDFATYLFGHLYDNRKVADQKASFLFASATAVLGFLLANDATRSLFAATQFVGWREVLDGRGVPLLPPLAFTALGVAVVVLALIAWRAIGVVWSAGTPWPPQGFLYYNSLVTKLPAELATAEQQKAATATFAQTAAAAGLAAYTEMTLKDSYALADVCREKYATITAVFVLTKWGFGAAFVYLILAYLHAYLSQTP